MFSKENADNNEIRKVLKEKYPDLIYVSRKSINADCYVMNSNGLILHQKAKAFEILELLTAPKINLYTPTVKSSGPGGDVPVSIENQIEYWKIQKDKLLQQRTKAYPDWKRRLKEMETTIKELRREI